MQASAAEQSEFLQRIPMRTLDQIHPDLATILAHLHPSEGQVLEGNDEDAASRSRLLEFFLAYRSNGAMTDSAMRHLLRIAQTPRGRVKLLAAIKRESLLDAWA